MRNTNDACSIEHNLQSCFAYSLQDLGYSMEVGHESSLTSSVYQNATQVIDSCKLVLIYVVYVVLMVFLFIGLQRCSYEEGTFVTVLVSFLHSTSGL